MIPTHTLLSHNEVISCKEAAEARGIALQMEVKTLVLKVGHRSLAAHLRGCDQLRSIALRRLFDDKRIRFLTSSELSAHKLSPGRINPWNTNFCQFHLVSPRLLELSVVGTNFGQLGKGILFHPTLLLQLPNVIIAPLA